MPKEHGTYGMLGVPLFVGLASGRPGVASFALAFSAVAGFLAHESALILLGHRGDRLRTKEGPAARRALWLLGGLCVGLGALGLATLPAAARPWLLLPVGLAGAMGALAALGRERTTFGEVSAAVSLSAWAVPVALAGGVRAERALTVWGLFAVGYSVMTVAIRSVIQAHKPRQKRTLRAAAAVSAVAIAFAGFAVARWLGAALLLPLALLSFCAVALSFALAPPHPRHLDRIGWSVIGVSTLAAVLTLLGVR